MKQTRRDGLLHGRLPQHWCMRQGLLRLARCFEAGKALSETVVGNRGQAPLPDGCLNSIFERLGVVVPGAMRWSGRRHAVEWTERGMLLLCHRHHCHSCASVCVMECLASTIGTSKVESGTPGVGDCDVQVLPSQWCLDWASGLKISRFSIDSLVLNNAEARPSCEGFAKWIAGIERVGRKRSESRQGASVGSRSQRKLNW